jgi:D-amino-acid dehydrogenase
MPRAGLFIGGSRRLVTKLGNALKADRQVAKEIIVLGAGMVGVCVAFHLARRGHQVVLVDRLAPGRETSFGNAGLIQREAVRPHPFPRDMASLCRAVFNRSVGIRYRSGAMLSASRSLLRYWRCSAPEAYARIVPEYASLIRCCTREHADMLQQAGAESLVRKNGWLQVFRTPRILDRQLAFAEDARTRFGVEYDMLDQGALHAREPALSKAMIGGIDWTNSWSVVDPGALVQAYAWAFESLGGRVVQAEARGLVQAGGEWRLTTDKGQMAAAELVLATGPWSNEWLERLGYRLPLFHIRGYHMHYSARDGAELHDALMDFEKGYLLAPKRAGIRLTTGAELNRLEAPPWPDQLQAAENEARRIFPLGERLDPQPWKGARPCVADMKPVIGPGHLHAGLWFAFGHGHQGFTLGPLTGRLIGEMMDDEPTCVDVTPFRSNRFE